MSNIELKNTHTAKEQLVFDSSSVNIHETTSKIPVPKEFNDDALDLAEAGYVQEYERRYNLITAIGFTIGVSGTWEGIVGSIGQALSLGGPSSLLWGFVLGSFGMSAVAASLAEMSSIYPVSGGQSSWVVALSPKKYRVFLSWVIAWTALTTEWICVICSGVSVAIQVQAYAMFARPDYDGKRWHVTLIFWLTLIIFFCYNLFCIKYIQQLNYIVIAIHFIGYLCVIISTVSCKEKGTFNSAKYAFSGFSNLSGWPDGLAWCVGILTTSMGFLGIETAVHFSEEIKNATTNVPRAIFWPVLMNSFLTIPMLICINFIVPSADVIFGSVVSGSAPSLLIWYEALKNIGGSIFLNAFSTEIAFICGILSYGSAGRMTYAMARDGALPKIFGKMNERYGIAIFALFSASFFPFVVGLIYIWNETALYGVMSGVTLSYQVTYFIPITLCFYARYQGNMNKGKWRLGKNGYWINGIAWVYLLFTIILLSFPTINPVTPANMNYAVVLLGFGWFLSIIFWFSYGRKHYSLPSIEITNEALEVVLSARSARSGEVSAIEGLAGISDKIDSVTKA